MGMNELPLVFLPAGVFKYDGCIVLKPKKFQKIETGCIVRLSYIIEEVKKFRKGRHMKKNRVTETLFVEHVEQQKDNMFRLAYSILRNTAAAEDAVSEAVLKAWEKRNSLRDVEKIKYWLLKIVFNVSKTMVVKRKREKLVGDMVSYADRSIPSATLHIEQKIDIWQIVMALKEEYRIVIIMYYYSDLTVKEISSMLRIPEGTVKNRLFRAREILKTLWSEERGGSHEDIRG